MIRQISGGLHFSYTRQSEALGLGHAVLLARDLVGEEPFAVLLGDVIHDGTVPATKALIDVHQRTGQGAITVEEVPPERVQLYGIVDVEPDSSSGLGDHYMRVRDVIEKPAPDQAPSNLAITGRYVLPSKVFEYIEKTEPGRNGEIQLTDALRLLAKNEGLWVYKYDGSTLDAGDKLGFLRATVEMALKNPELGPSFRNYLKTLKL